MFAGFCAASVVAVSLGLKFNPHYFVVALPAVGMLLGLAVAEVWERWKGRGGLAILSVLPGALFLGVCIYAIHADRGYFFLMTPEDEARFIYPRNPFTEAIRVADYIRTNSAPDARITVLGSEPEIYFYSHRRSATCFVSLYQLMEDLPAAPRLRQEMIAEIERVQPEYIVYVSNSTSWVSNGQVNNTILDWANHYLSSRYKVVGVVDGSSPDTPVYLWDAAIAGYTPKSPDHIFVFKKAG